MRLRVQTPSANTRNLCAMSEAYIVIIAHTICDGCGLMHRAGLAIHKDVGLARWKTIKFFVVANFVKLCGKKFSFANEMQCVWSCRIREEAFAVQDKGHGFASQRYLYQRMYVDPHLYMYCPQLDKFSYFNDARIILSTCSCAFFSCINGVVVICYVLYYQRRLCRSAWARFSSASVCLSVCLFVRNMTKQRMIPNCSNLV